VVDWVLEHKEKEVIGECRKLYNAERHGLFSLPNIIRLIREKMMREACCLPSVSGGVQSK
jgi:hypothetical protein